MKGRENMDKLITFLNDLLDNFAERGEIIDYMVVELAEAELNNYLHELNLRFEAKGPKPLIKITKEILRVEKLLKRL